MNNIKIHSPAVCCVSWEAVVGWLQCVDGATSDTLHFVHWDAITSHYNGSNHTQYTRSHAVALKHVTATLQNSCDISPWIHQFTSWASLATRVYCTVAGSVWQMQCWQFKTQTYAVLHWEDHITNITVTSLNYLSDLNSYMDSKVGFELTFTRTW